MSPLLLNAIFALLVFLSVAAATYGLVHVLLGTDGGDRRIRQRLGDQPVVKRPESNELTLLSSEGASPLRKLLNRLGLAKELEQSLKQATPDLTVERFLMIAGGIGLALFVFLFALRGSLLAGTIGMLTGFYLPFLWLANRRLRRQKMISEQLPDGLDFLGRSLRAGHSLPVGLNMMGDELPAPLCEEFGRCHDQIALGQSAEKALTDMCDRVESTDFAFFVTAVLVQRQTGGDLAQVLDNITGMLRQRIGLQNQVRAKTAEGRFTGYILAAFPLIMFVITYVMSPESAGVLVTTFTGKIMLGLALVMCAVGLFVIKKITRVDI